LSSAYRRIEPFALPNVFMATVPSVLAARGLILSFRRVRRFAFLSAFLLMAFPMIYHITHPSMAYRHPIDPLLALLSIFAFTGRDSTRKT
jgi:hypothetical protein